MHEMSTNLESLLLKCDEKKQKKYKIQTFIDLCNKVKEKNDPNIEKSITKSYELLFRLLQDETIKSKEYRRAFSALQKEVRDTFGFTAKGQLRSEYTGMGIAIGVAFGGGFAAINPAFAGIGLPIGLAIGAGIGDKKEKEAIEQGKVY